jgi:tRNA pseudouridine55 synthase
VYTTRGEIEAVLGSFRGTIEQVPPMFSALKQQGKRLYTLARQGISVDRQPRRIQIYRLGVVDFTAATLDLEVECSSGTYIRVLADDIGVRLGCGAHLSALVRTATGSFTLAQALTLAALEDAVRQQDWQRQVIPLSAAVAAFPCLMLTVAAAQELAHGMVPMRQGVTHYTGTFAAADTVALLGPDGTLLAMGAMMCGIEEWEYMPRSASVVKLRRVLS